MQLSDILEDTNAIDDAIDEVKFQKYLRWLSGLPDWKKRELASLLDRQRFTFADLEGIFNCHD